MVHLLPPITIADVVVVVAAQAKPSQGNPLTVLLVIEN